MVFYSQRLLKGLDSDAQLHEFLAASASNVAVMSGDTEPAAPLKVLKTMMVGRQAYYFVKSVSASSLDCPAFFSTGTSSLARP